MIFPLDLANSQFEDIDSAFAKRLGVAKRNLIFFNNT